MKILVACISFLLISCVQSNAVLQWSDFIPVGEIKVNNGTEDKLTWPKFSDDLIAKNKSVVTIEGYFLSVEALDIKTFKNKTVSMIACCEKPTIVICGVPQYKQHEFIVFDLPANSVVKDGDKVSVTGTLNLNTSGDLTRNLIRLEKVTVK